MSKAFIGLDLGTTSIKAVAFDDDRVELAAAAKPTPTHTTADGGAEYDANELWSVAAEVLRAVCAELERAGSTPVSIATASMGESGVLIDGSGEPVAPVIAWFDRRTEPQAEWWQQTVGAERTQRIAGIPPRPVFGAAKMVWTREHMPQAWAAGSRWLNIADWAAYRLTGEMATDYSLASRTMLFDIANRQWSDELLQAAELPSTVLAPLIQSGSRVGAVTTEASERTGLPAGTAVGAGGQDHVCAALALGVTEPGMLLDSIGTAEAFFLVTDEVDTSGPLAQGRISQGAHVEPGRTYAMVGLANGGGRIDARRRELDLDWPAFLATDEAATVIKELASDGQASIDRLVTAANATNVSHIVTGGGSRNDQLLDEKRRISPRPIGVAAQTESTALGAALLGRRALQ